LSRFLRRHATALIAIAVCNLVVFFPVVFMGRVVSPNDVFYSYSPWSALRSDTMHPQNLLINDPPTSYYTMVSIVKSDWRVFHWNPYIACGTPGFGTAMDAMVTPLIIIPLLLVPLVWIYTAIMFAKLNAAFFFAYLWLREERLGRRGAAIGAIVFAAASVYSVRWLWQMTIPPVFYPALLWIVARTFHRKPTSIALVAFIALCFATSAFPAAIAYGAWMVVIYALFLAIRAFPLRLIARGVAGVVIAFLIALPTYIPFARQIKGSGYLETRQQTSLAAIFPPNHWPSFVDADRLGNPAFKNWRGDPSLGVLNNYVEATVYFGVIPLLLALLGLYNRRARARWFWAAAALLILMCMFGFPYVSQLVARLPGFKYSALARTALLLPLPAAYLAAAGVQSGVRRRQSPLSLWRASQSGDWRRRTPDLLAGALAIAIAFDLGLVAGRFHPYLEVKNAGVPSTPVIDFLRHDRGPFRVAAFFDYFWPNSAELFRIEDVRSHFSSEEDYRRMLQRLDPGVWNGQSTVLQFSSLKYNFADPLAGMLGIRYYLEHKNIDIVKWGIFAATQPGTKNFGPMQLKPGATTERSIAIDAEPFWAIEVPAAIEEVERRPLRPPKRGPAAEAAAAPQDHAIEVTLLKNGAPVWSRRFTKAEADVMNKLYVPLRPYARLGEVVTLRVRAIGVRASLNRGENGFYYGRVTTPVIFDRELPDGRVFRNLAELPRFWAVSKFRKLNRDEFLKATDIDFANEAVWTARGADVSSAWRAGRPPPRVTLARYEPHQQRVITESPTPMFLASSEKLTPDLRVTIDGRPARAIGINLLFAGVAVPAGQHEVAFERRLARGWWWIAIVGAALWLAVAVWELTASLRRRRTGRRTATATAA